MKLKQSFKQEKAKESKEINWESSIEELSDVELATVSGGGTCTQLCGICNSSTSKY